MSAVLDRERLNFSQQRKIFNPSFAKPVVVLGAGSVGSQLVAMLAKIGLTDITVYDGDSVESHNIPMSAYGNSDLGMYKVLALKDLVFRQSGVEIKALPRMYAGPVRGIKTIASNGVGEPLRDSVIACVDSMEARMAAWQAVKNNPLVDIFIDTRTAGELISIFAVSPCNPDDIAYYEHFLYPTEQAAMLTCGHHGIVFISSMAAGIACANLTNWWQCGRKKLHFKELIPALEVC